MIAPAYYPDSRDLASARQIEVRAGQEFRAYFHLRSERGFRIVAAVSGMPGNANVEFSFEDASGQGVVFGPRSFDQGKARFMAEAVPSGTWKLALSADDSQGHSYELRQEIPVDGTDVSSRYGFRIWWNCPRYLSSLVLSPGGESIFVAWIAIRYSVSGFNH